MTSPTLEDIQQDSRAMAVARVMTLADQEAAAAGVDLDQSLITVMEELSGTDLVWRVHYGPRDYKNRRGGDLYVVVDERNGVVREVVLGQ
jgi:hypothetical protein